MKLSTRSEYACLAMIDLSERHGKGFVKIKDIAGRKDIPQKYLEQILLALNRAGYLKSRKGAEGGYMLSKHPSKISVAEVVRLMDGALAPVGSVSKYFYEQTPISQNKNLIGLFRDIRDYIADKMESTSFAELAKKR